MENWFKRVFLVAMVSASAASFAQDESEGNEDAADDNAILDQIISPDIERRRIDEDQLDNEDFEIGVYAGVLSVEDFGSNAVYGIRMAYHVTEDFFMEGTYAQSTLGETSFERLSGSTPLFSEEDRELSYYNIAIGWNVLPGEVFIGKNWSFNSAFYLLVGAGSTRFAEEQHFTYSVGGGVRLALTDWLAFHIDMRNHVFSHDLLGEEITTQNLEAHTGFTFFF